MFICLWGVTVLFLWFRRGIEIFWKILATMIFIFYLWFFYEEISIGFFSFIAGWYNITIDFLKELVFLTFANLLFFWPLTLILVFYKVDDVGAEKLLKFLCILTLVLWIVFVIYIYFNKGIDEFFYKNLRDMIPHAKPSQ